MSKFEFNHKKNAKLKTSVVELLGPLLKQLKLAQDPANPFPSNIIEKIEIMLEMTKEHLESREILERMLIGYFGELEREIVKWNEIKGEKNNCNFSNSEEESNEEKESNSNREEESNREKKISSITKKLHYEFDVVKSILEELGIKLKPFSIKPHEVGESSNSSNEEDDGSIELEQCMNELEPHLKKCLYSLVIFPENKELKKRLLVYWWIGMGIVLQGDENKTDEQLGEKYFSELVEKKVLRPVFRKYNQVVDRCTISPSIHKQLISSCRSDQSFSSKKVEEDGTWHIYDGANVKDDGDARGKMKALLNFDINYLNSSNINSLMKEIQVQVLHLGWWQSPKSEAHKGSSKDHIEVDEADFLRETGQSIRYLSLQGISGITELPKSIVKLGELRILDLRSCHNLERLPQKQKPRSKLRKIIACVFSQQQQKWFDKLTHLDISECYLLDSLPKWICELSNLEVLKGFVVGSSGKKSQISQLRDLSKLKKLRKLSIKVAYKHFSPEDFSGLELLDKLLVLTILWSKNYQKDSSGAPPKEIWRENTNSSISFPKNLDKLDIRCFPNVEAPELLNSTNLKELKRLYIRGGKIAKIRDDVVWNVEILRLRFLNKFDFDWLKLSSTFPKLKCMDYEKCPSLLLCHVGFPYPCYIGSFDDDEEVEVVSPPYPVKIITAPLAESRCDVELVLDSSTNREGLDLVVVLDISQSMKREYLRRLQSALSIVVGELSAVDRLSIVTFHTFAKRQCRLRCVTESFKTKVRDLFTVISDLINNLEAHGDTNTSVFDALQMGLKVLKDRRFGRKRAVRILLMSAGAHTNTITLDDAAIGNVPVLRLGIGPFDGYMCELGERLTEVEGLTLTITPIEEEAKIVDVRVITDYVRIISKHTNDTGSVIIKLEPVYRWNPFQIELDLFLPSTDVEHRAHVLQISYSYKFMGQKIEEGPVTVYVDRMREVTGSKETVVRLGEWLPI